MEGTIMDTKIIEQLEQAFAEEFKLVQNDLGAAEELVRQKMRLLGQGLLQRVVNQRPNGYKGSCILCECGAVCGLIPCETSQPEQSRRCCNAVVFWLIGGR
jgi:hypothetical protein